MVLPRENIADFIRDPAKLETFERGVRVMMSRPVSDPTSWWFQANIHGALNPRTGRPDRSNPLWNQCQHQHWWFLPWHRAYLYYLERMLQRAAGDETFRLPYWDYTIRTQRTLPAPFLNRASPLYVRGRSLRTSRDELRATQVETARALSRTRFIGSDFEGGFGGGRVGEPVSFPGVNRTGSLEQVPHNAVHVAVGGWMLNPLTAARDPIFWLHHCNIDRLWEVWLRSGGARRNPADAEFLNVTFTLINETGETVSRRVGDLLDTTQLDYTYPGLPAEETARLLAMFAQEPPGPELRGRQAVMRVAQATRRRAARIGADPVTIPLRQTEPTLRLTREALTAPRAVRYALVLRDIAFDKLPTNTYEVYLNLPTANHTTAGQSRHYVGLMAFFEPPHGEEHGAHGGAQAERTWTFDITEILDMLGTDQAFDPGQLNVTIVPVGPMRRGLPARPEAPVELCIQNFTIEAVQSG